MGSELPPLRIDLCELLQHVSRVAYRGEPLYYGRDGTNRYDDPAKRYGVLYPSRNNYPSSSIALFERAQGKVKVVDDIDLSEHVDWPDFVEKYQIGVEPDLGPPDES